LVDFILLSKVGGFLKIVLPLAIQVKWFGTHTKYDKIDVESIMTACLADIKRDKINSFRYIWNHINNDLRHDKELHIFRAFSDDRTIFLFKYKT